MPKTIYTERDIEDLARRGVKELAVTDDVYVTDVAREKAEKLGVALRLAPSPVIVTKTTSVSRATQVDAEQVVNQVKANVIARLGQDADAALIERIVRRVVSQLS